MIIRRCSGCSAIRKPCGIIQPPSMGSMSGDWIERNVNRYRKDGFGLWAVCLKDTGELIGDCGLTLQNIHGEILPEIGYHIRRDCQ